MNGKDLAAKLNEGVPVWGVASYQHGMTCFEECLDEHNARRVLATYYGGGMTASVVCSQLTFFVPPSDIDAPIPFALTDLAGRLS